MPEVMEYGSAEEVLEVLAKEIPFSEKLKGSVVLLDGYTGFTPVQMEVLRELLAVCAKVSVTVTMDVREQFLAMGKPHELFYMSHKMIRSLAELTKDMEEPVWIAPGKQSRFADSPALDFLEQHLFRYRKAAYGKSQDEIRIFAAESPIKELEETARRIRRMVREEDLKYGEILHEILCLLMLESEDFTVDVLQAIAAVFSEILVRDRI